jgi:serine acetyltransferase
MPSCFPTMQVPDDSVVVGVPARIITKGGERAVYRDTEAEAIKNIHERLSLLELIVNVLGDPRR